MIFTVSYNEGRKFDAEIKNVIIIQVHIPDLMKVNRDFG